MATEVGRHPVGTRTALEPPREPGPVLARRLRERATVALLAANAAGAVLTAVLGTWVVPFPDEGTTPGNVRLNVIAFAVLLVIGLFAGTYLSVRLARDAQRWLIEDRRPTPGELDATLRFPIRQTGVEALLWMSAAVIFTVLNCFYSVALGVEVGLEIVLGGLVTCSITYLLAERCSRPAVARALEVSVPDRPVGPAIGLRLMLIWAASSAVPLIAVGLVALSDVPTSRERIGLAVARVGGGGGGPPGGGGGGLFPPLPPPPPPERPPPPGAR